MPDPNDYTQDPDLWESDRTFARAPIYQEEAGRQPGTPTSAVYAPCSTCGTPVVLGQTAQGLLVAVEPQTLVYTLRWGRKERYPRATQGRGYPAHQCQPKEPPCP